MVSVILFYQFDFPHYVICCFQLMTVDLLLAAAGHFNAILLLLTRPHITHNSQLYSRTNSPLACTITIHKQEHYNQSCLCNVLSAEFHCRLCIGVWCTLLLGGLAQFSNPVPGKP
jgi:hypothetical protein